MTMKLRYSIGLGLLATMALTACFNEDDDPIVENPPPVVSEVPASAGASSVAFTTYVAAQVASTSETSEPLGTDLVAQAPGSETDEPITVN